MKKIFIGLYTLTILLSGCKKDFLDITPDGRISLEDVFSDEKRTEAYLNTVYGSIPSYFWKYEFFNFLAAYTDECYAYGGNVIAWWAGALSPQGNPIANVQERGKGSNHYPTFWTGIKDANVFLSNIDQANVPGTTNRNRFRAEAQLLRAFYYWELIKEFGPMPIIKEPFTPTYDYTSLARPGFQECVDFIVSDCDAAINNPDLPMRISIGGERGRFTKAVAYAIKSEALLYNASPLWNPGNSTEKWQAAASAAKEALDVLTSNGYALVNDYESYFLSRSDISNNPSDKETIYEINDPQVDPVFSIINSIPSKPGMFKVGATPTQELVDSYDMQSTGEPAILGYHDEDHLEPIINVASGYDPNNPYVDRDPRFYATCWYNGAQYNNIGGTVHTMETYVGGADQLLKAPIGWAFTRTGYYLRKFVDPRLQSGQPEDTRWKKYRLAELYLNFAEAENEANGPTIEAHNAINTIRTRVEMPPLPASLTKEQMRDRIRRERRVELAIEEHRFWDVRRWKILDQTDKVATGMEIKQANGPTNINIPNASFEDGTTGWNFDLGATIIPIDGYTSSYVVAMPDGGHVWTTISGLQPNTTYELSMVMLVQAGTGYLGVRNYGGDEITSQATGADGLTQKKIQFTTGSGNTTAEIFSKWPAGNSGMIDDFALTKVSGAYTYQRFITETRNAWQDKYLIMPIPTKETAIIPDFNSHQNPGW